MKIIFQILNIYSDEARIRIFNYLFHILSDDKNDMGLSIWTSQFYKTYCDRGATQLYIENAKSELFEILLNCLKDGSPYILEMTERLQAGLNLYIYLIMRERNLLKSGALKDPILTDPHYQ